MVKTRREKQTFELFLLDAEIRATLNSYQYLKRLLNERIERLNRLEPLNFVMNKNILTKNENEIRFFKDDDETPVKTNFRELTLTDVLNNDNGLDYFLSKKKKRKKRNVFLDDFQFV